MPASTITLKHTLILVTVLLLSLHFTLSPIQASTIIWEENFEGNLNAWTIGGDSRCRIEIQTPPSNRISPQGGKQLFFYRPPEATNDCYIQRPISPALSKGRISLWFFDNNDPVANPMEIITAAVDTTGTAPNNSVWLGVRTSLHSSTYTYKIGNQQINSGVPRSFGWHRFELVRQGGQVYGIINNTNLTHLGTGTPGPINLVKFAAGWEPPGATRIDGVQVASFSPTPEYNQLINLFNLQQINTRPFGWQPAFDAALNQVNTNAFILDNRTQLSDHDRFELIFNQHHDNIYGLGTVHRINSSNLQDFIDLNFSSGHFTFSEGYNEDVARMKTPIIVLPQSNSIISYLHQPDVKQLRLSRNNNQSTIVMSKKPDQDSDYFGKLLLVKGDSLSHAYQNYYQILKQQNYFFKKPHWKTFGIYNETYDQYGCAATLDQLQNELMSGLNSRGITLSMFVIGSGYWGTDNLSGCGPVFEQAPTTDTFQVSQERYGGSTPQEARDNLNNFFASLKNQGIYPMIGMRHNIYPGSDHLNYVVEKFGAGFNLNNTFLDSNLYWGSPPSRDIRFINFNNHSVINRFVEVVRESYSDHIMGFKEDEMIRGFQKSHYPNNPNFLANYIPRTYKEYTDKYDNDFILIGRNDYFGVGTDAQNTEGYLSGVSRNGIYDAKFLLDSMITQVLSGYPHPVMEHHLHPCPEMRSGNSYGSPKETLRTYQLAPFLPVTMHSCLYWQLENTNYVNAITQSFLLRKTLHKYAYDKAMDWYNSGIPSLMQPLILRPEWQNDSEVYKQYQTGTSTPHQHPRNQFMMGNALLIRPLLNSQDQVQVYLPSGKWKPFLKTGNSINGGQYITYNTSVNDFPVFFKEGEILIKTDNPSNTPQPNSDYAYVWLESMNQSGIYDYYQVDNRPNVNNKTRLQAIRSGSQIFLRNLNTGYQVPMSPAPEGNGFVRALVHSTTLSPTPIPTQTPALTPLPPFLDLIRYFNKSGSRPEDLNNDGKVNIFDLNLWVTQN